MMAERDTETIRLRVVYHGHVQGVLFRATSADLARNFDLVGHVRNAPDGTVELEAEGSPLQIEQLLTQIARRYEGYITDVSRTAVRVHRDETRFEIRY